MLIVDSHCHLNFDVFAEDLDGVVTRAQAAGVGVMQTICTEMAEFPEVLAIAERYEDVYCSVGVHPNDSGKTAITPASELIAATHHRKVIGIGETGLDYHYETSDRETQMKSLNEHLVCAQETGLPLIIHSRDADEDTALTLEKAYINKPITGVIHCFTSTPQLAERALDIGFYISFSGILTFKTAQNLRDIAATVPLDRLLVETDAPYLAPVPHRGKRNEPAFTAHTNALLAELKGISTEECARATTDNFFRLFSKASRPKMAA